MKVFLDTNVLIFGITIPEPCNSKVVLGLIETRRYDAFVSDLVIREIKRYFRERYGERGAYHAIRYIEEIAKIVSRDEIGLEIKKYKNSIAEKDLENLATAKHIRADFLIAVDKHYEKFPEYVTPKEFLERLKIKPFKTDY